VTPLDEFSPDSQRVAQRLLAGSNPSESTQVVNPNQTQSVSIRERPANRSGAHRVLAKTDQFEPQASTLPSNKTKNSMLFPQTLASEPRLSRTTLHASNESARVVFDLEVAVVSIDERNSEFASIRSSTDSQTDHVAGRSNAESSSSIDFDQTHRNYRHQKSVLDARLNQCGYPLQNVKTLVDEHQITLDGHVSRYYYMQVVLQIAMRVCGGRQIVNNLDVVCVQVE